MGAKPLSTATRESRKTAAKKEGAQAVKSRKRFKKTPRDILNNAVDFFQTRNGLYAAAAMCVVLVFITLGAFIFYKKELGKTAALRAGMKAFEKFVQAKDPKLRSKTYSEILFEAQQLADQLSVWTMNIDRLNTAIADIDRRLQKGWIIHDGNLYSFKKWALGQEQAKQNCADENSTLVSVENGAEEDFLEAHVTKDNVGYWIGLYRSGGTWAWIDGSESELGYWAADKPDFSTLPKKHMENCVVIDNNCQTPRKCWHDIQCNKKKYFICKLRPRRVWME